MQHLLKSAISLDGRKLVGAGPGVVNPYRTQRPDEVGQGQREDARTHAGTARIRTLVQQLDLSALFASFAGVGSAVTPPDLLLQVVLFQLQRQQLAPALWFRDSRESLPVRLPASK